MKITLCLTTQNDAESILNMQKITFKDLLLKYKDYDTNPANEPIEKIIKRMSQKERHYYFIKIEEKIIGVISVFDGKDGSYKKLGPIFILPQFQGKGYSQQAIKECERIHGEYKWELDTIMQEEKLCYLYEKMGYKQTRKTREVNENMTLVYYKKL